MEENKETVLTSKLKDWIKKTRGQLSSLCEENLKIRNENELYKDMMIWAVTHKDIVNTNGIFEHLRNLVSQFNNGKLDYFYGPTGLKMEDYFSENICSVIDGKLSTCENMSTYIKKYTESGKVIVDGMVAGIHKAYSFCPYCGGKISIDKN